MGKERPSHKWTSDETNLFSEILADRSKYFMETLERGTLKMHSAVKYLIPLLLNSKKMFSSKKKKKKTLKQKRNKPNWSSKSNRFLEKPCIMVSKV